MKSILKVKGEKNIFLLLISLIFVLGLSIIISIITRSAPNIYLGLMRPKFAPPPIVFGIVWPILYVLMALAFYRMLMLGSLGEDVTFEVVIFIIQFALNLLWPILFFYFNFRLLALIDLVCLIIVLIITVIKFYKKDRIAGILLIPYLIWSSFALILNYEVYRLNKNL